MKFIFILYKRNFCYFQNLDKRLKHLINHQIQISSESPFILSVTFEFLIKINVYIFHFKSTYEYWPEY